MIFQSSNVNKSNVNMVEPTGTSNLRYFTARYLKVHVSLLLDSVTGEWIVES